MFEIDPGSSGTLLCVIPRIEPVRVTPTAPSWKSAMPIDSGSVTKLNALTSPGVQAWSAVHWSRLTLSHSGGRPFGAAHTGVSALSTTSGENTSPHVELV